MCGICGYISKKLIPDSALVQMNDTMYHRGPDDSGIWEKQKEEYGIGLAHRRLSILDLSRRGHQPMLSDNGKAVIVFNGEIYNFDLLKEELIQKGYRFYSNCDTEVIIAAYQEWGCGCFEKMNGMFAIAIYDEEQDKVILARDRAGKKPLYYYHTETEFVFASELKPIMKYPRFSGTINNSVIGSYMCHKYIPSPQTIFLNTFKVEPGTYLVYQGGKIQIYKYWDLLAIYQNTYKAISGLEDAKQQLRELLRDSVSQRLVADVPVGTFLSGGIDSALITAIAQEASDEPVDSFTIGFYDSKKDEAPFAAQIARHIGTRHHELYMKEEQILQMLQELPIYYDEPFSDSSQLPSMLVSKMASENVTVALSGDGGDELFCGYTRYDLMWIIQHADWMGKLESKMPWNKALLPYIPAKARAFIQNRDCSYKSQMSVNTAIEEVEKLLCCPVGNVKFEIEKNIDTFNLQEKRMILDMITYLPDDILTKMDRASMKYSLEVRCPMLDYRIFEWSFQVSQGLKYHYFDKKYLLKELAYDYIPKELLDRPKRGFSVPLRRWLRTVLKPDIQRLLETEKLKKQGIFNPSGVKELILKQEKSDILLYSSLLWSLLCFQMWYSEYIEEI